MLRRNLLYKQRIFLIDGSALAYRSHFAFIRNPLINSKGQVVQKEVEKTNRKAIRLISETRGKMKTIYEVSGPHPCSNLV